MPLRSELALSRPLRAPHPLLSRFLAITLLLIAALAWLGWRLLEQDRALERQRTRDRLENSADLIAAALLRGLSGIQDSVARLAAQPSNATAVTRLAASLPSDAVLLIATRERFAAFPPGRLVYEPSPPTLSEPAASIFARGDSLEFRARNPAAAAEVYRAIANSRDASVRAAALLRVGRATRKTRGARAAADTYAEMTRLDGVTVNGVPAGLLARAARLSLWRETGDTAAARREAADLRDGLHSARWRIARSTFAFYDAEASHALALPPPPHGHEGVAARLALSEAATTLWNGLRAADGEALASSGARAMRIDGRPVLALWSIRDDRLSAVVGGPAFIAATLVSPLSPMS